ncbi:MAG: low molecular weight protein arginine phosphatase [Gemmatimonadota bacterium]
MSGSAPTPRPPGTTYNLLFVCTGNTCRSPMAEAIATGLLSERGWTHVEVRSAGISAADGSPATREAVDVSREQGLDLARHASRLVTPELLEWADLVLAMGSSHMRALEDLGTGGKAALVSSFLDGDGTGESIADPFGSDIDSYRRTFTELRTAVAAVLDRLEPILAP